MSRRPRRNHSAAFKAKVAIEALADSKTIAEVALKHDVHPNQVTEYLLSLKDEGIEGRPVSPVGKKQDLVSLRRSDRTNDGYTN